MSLNNTTFSTSYVKSVFPDTNFTYTIFPQSTANSTNAIPALPVVQSIQPTWIQTTNNPVGWELVNQLQWAITFGPQSSVNFNGSVTYFNGIPVCLFDCPRTVSLIYNNPTNVAATVTINGWDDQYREVVEQAYVPGGINPVVFSKSLLMIRSIYFSSYPWAGGQSNANRFTVSGSYVFGLPYLVNNKNLISTINYAGSPVPINTRTAGYDVVVAGNVWRQNGISPTTQILEGTDAIAESRGTLNLISLAGTTPPNGAIPLTISYYIYGAELGLNDQLEKYANYQQQQLANPNRIINYSNQYNVGNAPVLVQAQDNASGITTLPSLVSQDLYGAQFPYDLNFITNYNKLLTN